jgi:hypothetical protein
MVAPERRNFGLQGQDANSDSQQQRVGAARHLSSGRPAPRRLPSAVTGAGSSALLLGKSKWGRPGPPLAGAVIRPKTHFTPRYDVHCIRKAAATARPQGSARAASGSWRYYWQCQMQLGGRIDVDVLVVGAGPTGLLLAYQLARCGVQTRVIDRQIGAGAAVSRNGGGCGAVRWLVGATRVGHCSLSPGRRVGKCKTGSAPRRHCGQVRARVRAPHPADPVGRRQTFGRPVPLTAVSKCRNKPTRSPRRRGRAARAEW